METGNTQILSVCAHNTDAKTGTCQVFKGAKIEDKYEM
jgi:hypothetical protein